MIFTLVSGLQERLNLLVERVSLRKQQELERKKAEEEERERVSGARLRLEAFCSYNPVAF